MQESAHDLWLFPKEMDGHRGKAHQEGLQELTTFLEKQVPDRQ